jgi:hypothetical protein
LTSNKKGLVKPVVSTDAAPLPKNDEDSLYQVWPSREPEAERPRDELGRFATGKK